MRYEPVIGLEIHAELNTKTKIFCNSKNDPDEKHPNINICPICTGQPGTLPVINREAVNKVIKVGLSLGSKVAEVTKWDRKNYFYPDLPKGYQISQYDKPICVGGKLNNVEIRRIHLEEDTGRLLHFSHIGHSVIDFNRAGVPLMELVTEPDIKSGREARAWAEELQLILRYLEVSDADMEKGQLRLEANLSLKPVTSRKLGVKVEVKNLNSFKALERAIDYEIERQTKLLESGKKVVQETRGWTEEKGRTVSQREKEEAHDYRYFPEPDLPPLRIGPDLIDELKKTIPELPSQKRQRFVLQYNLPAPHIELYVSNKKLAGFFESLISEFLEWEKTGLDKDSLLKEGFDSKPHLPQSERQELINLASNYVLSDLLGLLNRAFSEVDDMRITAEDFAEFIGLIHRKIVGSRAAKIILEEMWRSGKDPSLIIREKDLIQLSDSRELEEIAQEVIGKNPNPVSDYQKGKKEALQFLIGQVMQASRGKANPEIIASIIKKLLD